MDFRKIQEAQERIGGPFAMTSILQKRVRELVQGARPLVETNKTRPIDIALEELLSPSPARMTANGKPELASWQVRPTATRTD